MVRILVSLMLIFLLAFSFAWASSNGTSDVAIGPVAITDGDGITPVPEIDMTWVVGTLALTARYGAVSGWYNGEVYFAYGRISNAAPYNTNLCESYNPVTNVWTTRTPAPAARRMMGAGKVQSENYIHSVGGRVDANTTVGTYDCYDMENNIWVARPPCTPRWAHGAAALPGGIVYVFGGDNVAVNSTVQRYDPAPINAWTAAGVVPNLPAPRGWCAGASLNGKIYCIGGSGALTMYEYTPGAPAWVTKAPLPALGGTQRLYHWAVADETADVIKVFGGSTGTLPTMDVLVYHQVTDSWSTETSMPGARNWPCVGGDWTESFYVVGGFDGTSIYYNTTWEGEECDTTLGSGMATIDLLYTGGSPVSGSGGPLDYTIMVSNHTPAALPFVYRSYYVALPSMVETSAFGPAARTAAPGPCFVIMRYLTQMVPGSLAEGDYLYKGYVLSPTGTVWDADTFPFHMDPPHGDGGAYVSEGTLLGWEEEEPEVVAATPGDFELLGNYPNPFNPTTAINYSLGNADFVNLNVFDLSGRKVATVVSGWLEAGEHEAIFDGSNLASGIYIYRLTAGAFSASGKMVLMK